MRAGQVETAVKEGGATAGFKAIFADIDKSDEAPAVGARQSAAVWNTATTPPIAGATERSSSCSAAIPAGSSGHPVCIVQGC